MPKAKYPYVKMLTLEDLQKKHKNFYKLRNNSSLY